ncbi:MAG: PaaI family thioesterase [Planctomycetes bacterium]|nr:PaaI family thioesterase [Planctomycetota bacterium]
MDPIAGFPDVPVNRELGLRLVEHTPSTCRVAMAAQERHVQGEGLIQGGVLSALADTAAVYLLLPTLAEGETCTSIEFKLNFLAPARVGAGELVAAGRLVKRGRRLAVCAVDVEQAGRPVATGLFTYLFLKRGS